VTRSVAASSVAVLLAIPRVFAVAARQPSSVRSGVLSQCTHSRRHEARHRHLAFLVFVIGSSLALYAWRAPTVGLGRRFEWARGADLPVLKNVLLMGLRRGCWLGTLYPLLLTRRHGNDLVGPPYFRNRVRAVMGAPRVPYGRRSLARGRRRSCPRCEALATGRSSSRSSRRCSPHGCAATSASSRAGAGDAFWVVAALLTDRRPASSRAAWCRTKMWINQPRGSFRGDGRMMIAHFGIASRHLRREAGSEREVERDVKMEVAIPQRCAANLTFRGREPPGRGRTTRAQGTVEVTRDGRPGTTLNPEEVFPGSGQTMTKRHRTPASREDLTYRSDEPLKGNTWIRAASTSSPSVGGSGEAACLMGIRRLHCATDRRYARRSGKQRRTQR